MQAERSDYQQAWHPRCSERAISREMKHRKRKAVRKVLPHHLCVERCCHCPAMQSQDEKTLVCGSWRGHSFFENYVMALQSGAVSAQTQCCTTRGRPRVDSMMCPQHLSDRIPAAALLQAT